MSTLQVSNLHFESTGNNRLQYTGSNAYYLIGGGTTVATINTTAVDFPLNIVANNFTGNAFISTTFQTNSFTVNTFTVNNFNIGANGGIVFASGNTITNYHVSTSTPTSGDGSDGDIWIVIPS